MIKRINIQGMVILLAVLVLLQLGFGFALSPIINSFLVDRINKLSGSRVSVEKVNIWPVTFSVSVKNLKVFNPDSNNERIASIGSASLRISPFGLLSKRLVASSASMNNAEITLEGEPDGSFNIEKVARPEEERSAKGLVASFFDRFGRKKDWFGRIYDIFKRISSKEEIEKKRREHKALTRDLIELPRGRRVEFKTLKDEYIFEIKKLKIKNALIHIMQDNSKLIDIDKAELVIRRLAFGPKKGVRFDSVSAKGELKKKGNPAGRLDIAYERKFVNNNFKTKFAFTARDIDLKAIRFIYKDSLPVNIEKGRLNMSSNTRVINEELDSRNSIVLEGHEFSPKGGSSKGLSANLMPLPLLCTALNGIEPLKLKFDITGTVSNPQFSGLMDTLKDLIKPSTMADIGKKMLEENPDVKKALDSVKSFLGRSEE